MARICAITGRRPVKGSIINRKGQSKKSGGIGTHVTSITKRKPALPDADERKDKTGKISELIKYAPGPTADGVTPPGTSNEQRRARHRRSP